MKNFILAALLSASILFLQGSRTLLTASDIQQRMVTVSGHVTDGISGEPLIGAGIRCGSIGAVTNEHGFYSISVPWETDIKITYSYVGYNSSTREVRLMEDTTIEASLKPDASIQEAMVLADEGSRIGSRAMGTVEIPAEIIRNMPALLGESDVLKVVQMMPGVQSGMEGLSGLYVRGGGPDENLLLLDGIPLYSAEHMLGLFSVFQSEAIKKVTLCKGPFPARYGGRISSIIDVRTRDGNLQETHGCLSVGMISDRLHIEGPLEKGRSSYSFSARGMHTFLFGPLFKALKVPGNYYFYDFNAKVTRRFSDRDRISISAYTGRDVLYFNDIGSIQNSSSESEWNDRTTMDWGNTVGALNWSHVLNGRTYLSTTVAATRYHMDLGYTSDSEEVSEGVQSFWKYKFGYGSGMMDISARSELKWDPSPEHSVIAGIEYAHHICMPQTTSTKEHEGKGQKTYTDTTYRSNSRPRNGDEFSLYIEDTFRKGRFMLNPGLRLTAFIADGRTYFSPEPRLSAGMGLWKGGSLKVGYSRMSQYVHLLSPSQISLPLDLWVPVTRSIKPVLSDQVSAGLYQDLSLGWKLSAEAYLKWMHNILDYKDGFSFLSDTQNWESNVAMGEGWARGLEIFIQKTAGRTTGWLGYTLAKSERQFRDGSVCSGRKFPSKYDRRHDVSLVLSQKIRSRITVNAAWTFATGSLATVPERETVQMGPEGEFIQASSQSTRNNFRLPASHRLNIGTSFHKKLRHGERVWTFSVYNVYNRKNPNFVRSRYMLEYDVGTSLYERKDRMETITLLPFLPSFSYTWNF